MTTTRIEAPVDRTKTIPTIVANPGTAPTTRSRLASFSVRTRITVAVFLLVFLALGGTGLLVYALGAARITQQVPDAVSQEMDEFDQLQRSGIDPDSGERFTSTRRLVTTFLLRNVATPSELQVGFWDGAVEQVSASTRAELVRDSGFVEAINERLRSGGVAYIDTRWGEVYLDVQPLQDAQGEGAFVVAYFLEDERQPLRRTMRTYGIAAAVALVLVTAVAALQAGRLLRPVRILREAAEEISETDLTRRIPEVGNDDLTDLTRTVNAMLARLDDAFEGQREFLDDAGHELRTPLTILRGHLELLNAADAGEVDRTRDLLMDEIDRMSRLVDDLILLTKADRPDFFTFAHTDVADLTDLVFEKIRALGDRDWQVDECAETHAVLDQQRITQALVQLAQNAVKHTRPHETIGIGSAVSASDGTLRLWVRDNGDGVAEGDKQMIFERFARAGAAADDPGFGLGLSIVAAIVNGHGGSVQVLDEAPQGARFVIELPVGRGVASWLAS